MSQPSNGLYHLLPKREFRVEAILDLLKAACAALLFVAPWLFRLAPVPAWNLWIVAYLMLTCSLAKFVAEADWETQTNCCLALWVLSAPWMLGFSSDGMATIVHVAGGSCVCILCAVELWGAQRNPPWRFGPASALRAPLLSLMTSPPERPAPQMWTPQLQLPALRTSRRVPVRRIRIRRRLGAGRAPCVQSDRSMSFSGWSNVARLREASRAA